MRKLLLGLVASATLAAPLALAGAASATDGQQVFGGGDFSAAAVNTTTLPSLGFDTSLAQTTLFGQAHYPGGDGSMYDPGTYVIGGNPRDFHELWVDEPGADPQLIVNGALTANQKVLEKTVSSDPSADCKTGAKVTFDFKAAAHNIVPTSLLTDGGAKISVTINGVSIGSADLTSNDPASVAQIVGAVNWAPTFDVAIWNNGTVYSGNDFALDDITLTQRGECEPPCEPTVKGVWFNYTGKFTGTGVPLLNDPKWHALPATPGGEHDVTVRGFDKPYQPGKDKGKGDWFVWRDLGTTCPPPA